MISEAGLRLEPGPGSDTVRPFAGDFDVGFMGDDLRDDGFHGLIGDPGDS